MRVANGEVGQPARMPGRSASPPRESARCWSGGTTDLHRATAGGDEPTARFPSRRGVVPYDSSVCCVRGWMLAVKLRRPGLVGSFIGRNSVKRRSEIPREQVRIREHRPMNLSAG